MEQELRSWVIHVDVRCAIDLPFIEKRGEAHLPSTFVECGWTVYNERPPDPDNRQTSKTMDEDCNPIYNESFTIKPPASIHERDGFLYVGLQYEEKYDQEDLGIYIPLNIMSTFVPYHFVDQD